MAGNNIPRHEPVASGLTGARRCPLDGGMKNHSGRLAHLGALCFSGADTTTFLQGQVSNDARRLAAGRPLLAALANNQGRVFAILHLLPHASGVVAIVAQDLVAATLERLRKYVLRAKVRIAAADEQLTVAGQHDAAALQAAGLAVPDAAQGYAETDGIGVARVAAHDARCFVVGAAAVLANRGLCGAAADATRIEADWRRADIEGGMPQIYAATCELFVPQMLNLDLIDGISFNKGCYTGQEIVARTQHLGRIKRRMFRLQLPPGDYRIGQALMLPDGRSGRITELAALEAGWAALAVLPLESAPGEPPEETGAAAVAAAELPLPYPVRGPVTGR